jgi:hypothetical protein
MSDITAHTAAAIAAAYLRYVKTLRSDASTDAPTNEDEEAAYDRVDRLNFDGPADAAWLVVREILRQTPDEELYIVAAGPLEELVRHHAYALEANLLAEAETDERFRWALGGLWVEESQVPPRVWLAIRKSHAER